MMHKCCKSIQRKEEEVLYDNRSVRKAGRRKRRVLFDSRPRQIDVKQKKKDSKSND